MMSSSSGQSPGSSSSGATPGGAEPENPIRSFPGARIEAQKIDRNFPESGKVVDSVSLKIAEGEFVSILGPSGCGKSTFLRLLAGLDRPDGGSLKIETGGANAFFRSFVFQEAHLVPWRTVLRNVMLPLELLGVSREEAEERARLELDRVHLGDALSKYPKQLSGGMKMRVSVARALVTRPRLLLLDEPFSALDENTRYGLQQELRSIWEAARMTVVFVTHSVSEAVYLSNRVLVFSKRPAKLALDLAIGLPDQRSHALRQSPEFGKQMAAIYSGVPEQIAPL